MDLKTANDKAFAMLAEGYKLEWKSASPKRANLNKKEDIAFVTERKRILFNQRQKLV